MTNDLGYNSCRAGEIDRENRRRSDYFDDIHFAAVEYVHNRRVSILRVLNIAARKLKKKKIYAPRPTSNDTALLYYWRHLREILGARRSDFLLRRQVSSRSDHLFNGSIE